MAKNICGKARKLEQPYAVYKGHGPFGNTEVRVLKTYQTPDNERKNSYARWFVAVSSDFTYGSFDIGDSYIREAIMGLTLVEASDEWKQQYEGVAA